MLKNGIRDSEAKQHAAEAFINFCSRPDNAVRNMYYIGYTSVISGGDDPTVFEYADYNYSAEDDAEETQEYDLGYFFDENGAKGEYVIEAPVEMLERQLYAAYPPDDVMRRSSIMTCFDEQQTAAINQMWINVRCYNLKNMPVWGWFFAAVAAAGIVYLIVIRVKAMRKRQKQQKKNIREN
jgi:spermidine/putrescine transport system substrate-binding protein